MIIPETIDNKNHDRIINHVALYCGQSSRTKGWNINKWIKETMCSHCSKKDFMIGLMATSSYAGYLHFYCIDCIKGGEIAIGENKHMKYRVDWINPECKGSKVNFINNDAKRMGYGFRRKYSIRL